MFGKLRIALLSTAAAVPMMMGQGCPSVSSVPPTVVQGTTVNTPGTGTGTGNAGTPTGGGTQTPPATPPTSTTTPRLFIACGPNNNVVSYANPSTVNGNVAPDTNLQGANTQLNYPLDMLVNKNGGLIVVNPFSHSLTTYPNAANANGNITPIGNLQGPNTQLGTAADIPVSLTINKANDILFVSKFAPNPGILVYTNASSAAFTGNTAPTRQITNAAITQPAGINLDASGNLYIANRATNQILVYASAMNINGNVAPTRVITGNPAFNLPYDVYVDSQDRMFVVNLLGGRIDIFNNASTLNGNRAPDVSLLIPGALTLTGIAIDSKGTGYITDNGLSKVYSYDNIATLNGLHVATRTIAGPNTLIVTPNRCSLSE